MLDLETDDGRRAGGAKSRRGRIVIQTHFPQPGLCCRRFGIRLFAIDFHVEGERLEREAGELLEAAEKMELRTRKRGNRGDRPGNEKDGQRLKERLQDLLTKESKLREANASEKEVAAVRDQIARVERDLHAIHEDQLGLGTRHPEFHAQAEKFKAASRRIHHLRVAAENLKLAEAHDLAR